MIHCPPLTRILAGLALSLGLSSAQAQEPIKIGMLLTLSGPPAVLGEHIRDAFLLAVKEHDGQLGGVPVEVSVVDDELKPDSAITKAQALVERDQVDFVVGTVFSNVMMAVFKPIVESETFLISPNAGPSPLAGRACSPFYFNVAWQNDGNHEVMGQYATDRGYGKVILMAPNYQAGKDSMAGFKRYYRGEVLDEIYTQMGQLDFSAELARIAAAKPDALFTFMPGGMGVNLVKQYQQAGLAETTPFLSAFTVDETTLPATQDAALGMNAGSQWAPNLDNPQNQAFVEAFEAEYEYAPSLYASQGYDAALLLDSAIRTVGGDISDKDALREALKAADFDSVRGDFQFNSNHFPVQDYYLVEAVQDEDGDYVTSMVARVFEDHADAYVDQCGM